MTCRTRLRCARRRARDWFFPAFAKRRALLALRAAAFASKLSRPESDRRRAVVSVSAAPRERHGLRRERLDGVHGGDLDADAVAQRTQERVMEVELDAQLRRD